MIWKKQPVGSKLSDLQNNKASKDTATQSAAGLMSAADKTKLDGVATGATAVSVVNNLNSDSTTSALSAAQGKALNSKIEREIASNTDFNSYSAYDDVSNAYYYGSNISAMTNRPVSETNAYPFTLDVSNNGSYIIQKIVVYTSNGVPNYYIRQQYYANGTKLFGDWQLLALNSKIESIGTILTGAWTATSSSATNVQLTESITLTKGVWIVMVTIPFIASGTSVVGIGPNSSDIDNNQFGNGTGSGGQTIRFFKVTSTNRTIYGVSASSNAVTYDQTYLLRGGIRAIKISI